MRTRALALVLVISAVMATLACSSDPEIKAASFTAADYSFSGPATLEAGTTTITLNNTGNEAHHIQLVKIDGDHTIEELLEAGEELPDWASEAGGPSVAMPGSTSNATFELEAGEYALLCFIPNVEGVPHVALGMSDELTVTASDDDFADLPNEDVTVNMADFAFQGVPDTLDSGETTFQVSTIGAQAHETVLVRLNEGATPEQFLAAFDPAGPGGPPPGAFAGGFQGIVPGGEGTFTANLTAGNYALLCFITDLQSGAPHFALGMVKEVSVGG